MILQYGHDVADARVSAAVHSGFTPSNAIASLHIRQGIAEVAKSNVEIGRSSESRKKLGLLLY